MQDTSNRRILSHIKFITYNICHIAHNNICHILHLSHSTFVTYNVCHVYHMSHMTSVTINICYIQHLLQVTFVTYIICHHRHMSHINHLQPQISVTSDNSYEWGFKRSLRGQIFFYNYQGRKILGMPILLLLKFWVLKLKFCTGKVTRQ